MSDMENQERNTPEPEGSPSEKKRARNQKKTVLVTVLLCFLVLLGVLAAFAFQALRFASEARADANAIKKDVQALASAALALDADGTDRWIAQFDRDTEALDALLDSPLGRRYAKLLGLRPEVHSADLLIDLAAQVSDQLLKPYAELQRQYPLSELKAEDGFRVSVINAYLDFAQEKIPELEKLSDALEQVDLGSLDRSGKVAGYRETLASLLDSYRRYERYVPLFRLILGDGEDKLYFFAAQNSSEIRSSGGFPGSVGTIRIQDGILRIGHFGTVTGVLAFNNPPAVQITPVERMLSNGWMDYGPRDADFCPDFERVAEIWSIGYEAQNGERPDGVISATPVIIQRLLGALGEIQLSDGSVLNGDNAVRVLEYDLYYRYLGAGSNTDKGNRITDGLFAETVEKLMEKLVFTGELQQLQRLAAVLEESAADRTLMFWFPEEEKQQLVRDLGLAATLNSDPSAPEAGVYFSLADPGRMGWFLNMDVSTLEQETHEDGSKTYAVTVTLSNVMTQEELAAASSYIHGSSHGHVVGYLYLFAPAGGTIGSVESIGAAVPFQNAEYHGLDLAYTHRINVLMGETVSFQYTVTTAPGEQAPLAVSMTPTLQNYR